MKKKLITLTLITPLVLGMTGCVVSVGGGDHHDSFSADHSDREYKNRKQIARLSLDMSIKEVQAKMGVADFNEVYSHDGEQVQVLFYRTHRVHADGMTTKDECTPLLFKQGMLDSWGDSAFAQIRG